MSHRIPPDPYRMRPRHDDAMLALMHMITDFIVTLKAGETIGTVQRENAINIIHEHRPALEACTTPLSQMMKHLHDPEMMNHSDLILWLTNLSIDLKLEKANTPNPHERPLTVLRMDEGMRMVIQLELCRERTVFYR